jgi:hypothetical protein
VAAVLATHAHGGGTSSNVSAGAVSSKRRIGSLLSSSVRSMVRVRVSVRVLGLYRARASWPDVEQCRVGEGGLLVDAAEPREEREHKHGGQDAPVFRA